MQETQMLTADDFACKLPHMPGAERKAETLAFRVSGWVYEMTEQIADKERRKLSDVERAIYERGLAAYQRDGLLFEPVKPQHSNSQQAQESAPKTSPGKRSVG